MSADKVGQEEGGEESKEHNNNNDILGKEVKLWKGFEYALRQPNASLFNRMLTECSENKECASAIKTQGTQMSTELLFMALIFQQQKMIRELLSQLSTD
jgi:hypothetical protein